ncbi:MAG: YeeE/YedE family protein [Deltaproteobacteria bacterium]|nr:YeeE/YedE family protein [Deltaproteobacteria bacterium]
MTPFDIGTSLGHGWLNFFYVITGIGFGFALEQAGFGNSRNLAAQFYLKDMRVFKVLFTAIITAMLLIFWFSAFGLLEYEALYINPTYLWSGILGGLIFGAGFVIGGYCPGTALVSMSTFKIDGLFFVLGLGLGMFFFGETIDGFRLFWETSGFYGEVTLQDVFHIQAGLMVFLIVIMALGMFWGAEKVEAFFSNRVSGGQA